MTTRRSVSSRDERASVQYDDDDTSTIMMEDELENKYGILKENEKWTVQVQKTLRKTCSCSGPKAKRILFRKIPILDWLPKYKVRENLLSDIIAGITVGIVHLPQGLAYADLADLPPIYGLYVSFLPVLVFMLLGTCKHVSIGTYAVISIMVGNAISARSGSQCSQSSFETESFSPTSVSTFTSMETTVAADDSTSCDDIKLELAIALAMATGIIQTLMSVLRLGIVTTYLSTHLISGFTCGAAFHVLTSQISKLLGIDVSRKSGTFALIRTYIEIFQRITETNWATVIVSTCCIIFLVIGKEINRRYHDKLPISIPWELGVVVFSTMASYFGYLSDNYGVAIVGHIPTGIQTTMPNLSLVGEVMVDSIAIAIVAFATDISLAQMFSEKHSYKIDADQELLALGAGNIVGSFFSCYPAATSLSRSIIWEESGGKTQLTGAFSSILILFILFWIGPLFESVPSAALAAIIVVNLKGMLRQFEKIPPLWRVSKIDAIIWIVTWASVFLLGVSIGLVVGVAFEIFTVVVRDQLMTGHVIGKVGEKGEYRSSKEYHTEKQHRNIIIFQFPGSLIFANKARFQKQISYALGFDPAMALKNVSKEQSKVEKSDNKEPLTLCNGDFNDKDTCQSKNEQKQTHIDIGEDVVIENGKVETANADLPQLSTISYPSHGVSHLILDMSHCPYVDNDGAQTLKKLYGTLKKIDIRVYLADCNSDIRRALTLVCEEPPPFYVSIDSAVEIAKIEVSNQCTTTEEEANRTTSL